MVNLLIPNNCNVNFVASQPLRLMDTHRSHQMFISYPKLMIEYFILMIFFNANDYSTMSNHAVVVMKIGQC